MSQKNGLQLLNVGLWIAQLLLILVLLMTGLMKLFQPIEKLATRYLWMGQVPAIFLRFLGLCNLLGCLGLLLPSLLRIKPVLTVWTAFAIIVLMICAIVFHLSRGETQIIGFNILIAALAAFVAWGRSKRLPIRPKI
ncbi:DoxX family protein [Chitinophaga sp.]|uniref:DoxX family protein n=1 Tax=Chitinophaga sp. TaxID=1869181 RepID=UPI0031DC51C8